MQYKKINSNADAISIILWKTAKEQSKGTSNTNQEDYDIMLSLKEWITKQTTPFHIRTKYLTLVEKWGTEEQKREVIDIVRNWTQNNPLWMYRYYLRSAPWGDRKQKTEAISETKNWLKKNQNCSLNIEKIRKIFLYLVLDWGILEEKEEIFNETYKWLEKYPRAFEVRRALIYLASWMTEESKKKLLIEVKNFLNSDKEITEKEKRKICVAYLYLASYCNNKQFQIAQDHVNKNFLLKANYRRDYINASEALLSYYIENSNNQKKCLEIVAASLKYHPENLHLRTAYLLLIVSLKKKHAILKSIENQALERCKEWSQESWVSSDFWDAYLKLHNALNSVSRETMSVVGEWIENNPEYIHSNVKQYYEYCIDNMT